MAPNFIEGFPEASAEGEAATQDEAPGAGEVPEQDDATDALATLLCVDRDSVLGSLGGRWQALRPPYPIDSPEDLDINGWFIAGDPIQVLLGVSTGSGHVLVSLGRAVRYDSSLISEVVSSARSLPLEGERWLDRLGEAVQDAAKRSRRSFFWCSICRTCNRPDDRYEEQVCLGCAGTYFGVVS